MIERLFSPDLLAQFTAAAPSVPVQTVDRRLPELVAAGLFAKRTESLVWLIGENENPAEKIEKLRRWLRLLELEDVPLHQYLLPFADPYISNSADPTRAEHKVRLLSDLAAGRRIIVLTTLAALNVRLERDVAADEMLLELESGAARDRAEVIDMLSAAGYVARDFVEEHGDMSWRGSILDVFPVNSDNPLRLEFEGRRILSMRWFDSDSQRSLAVTAKAVVYPIRYFFHEEAGASFFGNESGDFLTDSLPQHQLLAVEPERLQAEFDKLLENYHAIWETVREEQPEARPPAELFTWHLPADSLWVIREIPEDAAVEPELLTLPLALTTITLAEIEKLQEQEHRGYRLCFCAPDDKLLDNVTPFLRQLQTMPFPIPESIVNHRTREIFITRLRYIHRESLEQAKGGRALDTDEIAVGDYVVHRLHGIGRFVGFTTMTLDGCHAEYLKLEYQNKEFLYVPVYEVDVLSKYKAFENMSPALDRMGGVTWKQKSEKARKSMIHFARELLELYARRKSVAGTSHTRDEQWENLLWESFPYIETEDQKRAIHDVLHDLEAPYPMDRLVCGDVSFGKTEVAVRAAARVALGGRQVAVVCPTTILAFQHLQTFRRRLAELPLRVEMLSRLVPTKAQTEIRREVQAGKVDVLIGTHSLLSKKVEFRALGLCIIDEEQRFGVFQKEKLKQGREDIDVLTMTATPIPRTLSMSMADLQDISLIHTPPMGRLAVKNYVGYFAREVVVSAVLNEIDRDGLVFMVYNNIERILSFKERIAEWLPDVSIAVIHAQMEGEVIEKTLMEFIDKRYRILLSTTIIENGIDIPSVNTLMVIDADHYGLTQLYQLRGRIGRSSRQAYAYFLVERGKFDISEKAKKRLDAIREFSDLGSGFRLAEFDLQLRGAGSLLGNRQHGHVEALGFEYYLDILRRTIQELKGEREKEFTTDIRIHFSFAIDANYIRDERHRIRVYRSILEAGGLPELERLKTDLADRYGALSAEMQKLFLAGVTRIFCRRLEPAVVDIYPDHIAVQMSEENPDATLELPYTDYDEFCLAWMQVEEFSSTGDGA